MTDDITKAPAYITPYADPFFDSSINALLKDPKMMSRLEQSFGVRQGQIKEGIFQACAANPELYDCEPISVLSSAFAAAAVGLSIIPALGQAAIMPFKKWKKDNLGKFYVDSIRASFAPMVRGYKVMAMRTLQYLALHEFLVYEGQEVIEDQVTGKITFEPRIPDKSKPVKGYGAYLKLVNGFEYTVYWSKGRVMQRAIEKSPSWDKRSQKFSAGSFWDKDFDHMALKTAMKDLIINHGIISAHDREILQAYDEDEESFTDDVVNASMEDIPPAPPKSIEDLTGELMGEPKKAQPAKPAPAPATNDVDYVAEHKALWREAQEAGLLNNDTIKAWAVRSNAPAELVAEKCAAIRAALGK